MNKNVYAIAMSGGVDSSTVAALLQNSKYDIFGVTMNIHDNCGKAIEDASKICQKLGIEHFVLDAGLEFKKHVIDAFIDYYSKGLTPNPCSFCNRDIKMNFLLNFAREKGANFMATGHYVNLSVDNNDVLMREAKNPKKDQSYFLALVSKENLKYIRFPLGNIESKEETRKMALNFGLHNFEKKDSQDICFIPDNNYKSFLNCFDCSLFSKGHIISAKTNEVLGEHTGIANYTIGQRKGLGISSNEPLYVVRINSNNNEVVVGTRDMLDVREFMIRDANWILETSDKFEAFVKLRSLAEKNRAIIHKVDNNKAVVTLLDKSTTPITQGQICAIYNDDNYVIGGGIIQTI